MIYALMGPDDSLPRYVGRTIHPKPRLSCHLTWARTGNDKSAKADWLRELLAEGQRPLMILLEAVPSDLANSQERTWIERGRQCGWPLLNKA